MISQIILHIGLHRTGTTSFQVFLNNHRAELLSQGFSVYQPLDEGINAAELRAAAILARGERHYSKVKRSIYEQCSSSEAEALILSAESLWTVSAVSDLKRLKALFPSDIATLRVIIVLRDSEVWARRHWDIGDSQRVNIDQVEAMWNRTIEGYNAIVGDVDVLNYESVGMVPKMCEAIGIDITGLKVDYTYHKTTKLKTTVKKRYPRVFQFYSRYLANSFVGKLKRKLLNE